MTISQSAEYALRAVVWLAAHPERTLSTLAIAKGTRVPAGYLSKVLQGLARAGLVQSCSGRTGGFSLTRSPSDMSVLDIVNAVDPVRRIRTCPLGLTAHGQKLCALHARLDEAASSTELAFGCTTIAQLIDNERPAAALCEPLVALSPGTGECISKQRTSGRPEGG